MGLIQDEISLYEKGYDVKPVNIEEYKEQEALVATKRRISRLLELYIKGELDKVAINYLFDVFDLYPYTDYENNLVEEIVDRIANQEIHSGLEEETIRDMLTQLDTS
jgi:hypothetical protein